MIHLASAHPYYSFHIQYEDWERSLYWNLLLQPALSVPDHFLFSPYVYRHLTSSRSPWLLEAISGTILRPRFRGNQSFKEFNREFGSQLGGLAASQERQAIAHKLDSALQGVDKRYDWGRHTLGVGFQHKLTQVLAAPQPPTLNLIRAEDAGEDVLAFWADPRIAKEWRSEWPIAAAELTAARRAEGLRITDLAEVIWEKLFDGPPPRPVSFDTILQQARGLPFQRHLRLYCQIVCEAYNANMAKLMGAGTVKPNYDLTSLMATSPHSSGVDDDHDWSRLGTITLPTISALEELPSQRLLAIRNAGSEYFKAHDAWLSRPTLQARDALAASLIEYTRHICEESRSSYGAELLALPWAGWVKLVARGALYYALNVPQTPLPLGLLGLAVPDLAEHLFKASRSTKTKAYISPSHGIRLKGDVIQFTSPDAPPR